MLVALLALSGAAAYGAADFLGGLLSRRTSAWAVAFVAALAGGLLGLVATPFVDGRASGTDLLWASLGGLGAGVGTAFLYRGLAAGRMGVVAPISGVGAALLPVAVAVLVGERPGALVWTGIAFALPGIWLVAREPRRPGAPPAGVGAGVVDGVLAGLGFGGQFAALGQVSEGSGMLPLALNQLAGAATIVLLALALRAAWLPRDRAAYTGAVCGALGLAATGTFLVAAHWGSLVVSAILSSLYPAFTILLAATFLRERVQKGQALGLALCTVTVVLVAAG